MTTIDIAARIAADLAIIVSQAEKHGTLMRLKSVAIYFDEIELRTIIASLQAFPSSSTDTAPPQAASGALKEALDLAVNLIMESEPSDSRAVSNEAVALAAVACGDTSDAVMKIIRAALSRQDAPQGAPVIAEPANKPAIDPKKIKAIDHFLADGERDKGYRAFAMMRHIWPQLRELALASSQLDEDSK